MDKEKAVELLIQAILIAQKRGAFELGEAKIIADAVELLKSKPSDNPVSPQPNGSVASPTEYLPTTKPDEPATPTQ